MTTYTLVWSGGCRLKFTFVRWVSWAGSIPLSLESSGGEDLVWYSRSGPLGALTPLSWVKPLAEKQLEGQEEVPSVAPCTKDMHKRRVFQVTPSWAGGVDPVCLPLALSDCYSGLISLPRSLFLFFET